MSKGSWDRSTPGKRVDGLIWKALKQNPVSKLADKLATQVAKEKHRATDKKG